MSRTGRGILVFVAAGLVAACGVSAASPSYTYAPPASQSAAGPSAAASPAEATPAAASSTPSANESPAATASLPAGPDASGPAANTIQLREWEVTMPTEIKAGMVTFTIANMGAIPHELIGFRSPLDPVAYPRTKDGNVNEEGKGIVSATDGENIEPAGTQTRTVDLTTPGRYVFMCNIPGHFEHGMYVVLTVTP